jgi:hypothetical protein
LDEAPSGMRKNDAVLLEKLMAILHLLSHR